MNELQAKYGLPRIASVLRTPESPTVDRDRGPAHRAHRRGPRGRGSGVADARRTNVVVPVPEDDPGSRRRRASSHGARPRGIRTIRQACRPRQLLLPEPRQVDERLARRQRPAPPDALLPGLGLADRPAHGRRDAGPVRPRLARQWRIAHGRHAAAARLSHLARVRPFQSALPDRPARERGLREETQRGRDRSLRRTVSGFALQDGSATLSGIRTGHARRPRASEQ